MTAAPTSAHRGLVVGLDVGGTTIRAQAAAQAGGDRVADAQIRDAQDTSAPWVTATPTTGPAALLAALREGIAAVGDGPLEAVGIAIPGVVDAAEGTVAHAVNLGLTAPLPLAATLRRELGVPVVVDNDVRAAGIGALAHLRAARPDVQDLLLVNLGTGVAAAVVVGGRVHRGPSGLAGEIGHVPVPGGDRPCPCGLRGCLETRLAGPALRRRWPNEDGRSAHHLFSAAAAGDPVATTVADDVIGDLAWLVHFLANLTGIGDVVIGGGIATAHPALLAGLRDRLADRADGSALSAAVLDPDRVVAAPPDLGVRSAVALARTATAAHGSTAPQAATHPSPHPAAPATHPRPTPFGMHEGETR